MQDEQAFTWIQAQIFLEGFWRLRAFWPSLELLDRVATWKLSLQFESFVFPLNCNQSMY